MHTNDGTHSYLRRSAAVFACLGILVLAQCDSSLLAPDGSTITLSVNPIEIAVDGDSATVTAFVYESDGRAVDNGTNITFLATSGALCAGRDLSACAGGSGAAAATVTTRDGVATAILRSGPASGTITISARSGTITQSTSLSFLARVAPSTATVVLQAAPDTIPVGTASVVTAFLSTASGPIVNGSRVVFTAPDSAVQRSITTTREGFTQTTVVGRKAGPLLVKLTSGTVRDSITLVVK